MQLSQDQRDAVQRIDTFMHDRDGPRMLALAGAAGTGKSTIIGNLVSHANLPRQIRFTATTNKAAGVAAAMAGGQECPTVHKVFGLAPVRTYNGTRSVLKEKNKPKYDDGDIIFVDESSMVDDAMFNILMRRAGESDLKLLFIGDPYQLPPVTENVDQDETPPVFRLTPTVSLTKVHRQAEDSPILSLATEVRQSIDRGSFPKIESVNGSIRVFEHSNQASRASLNELLKEMLTCQQASNDHNYVRLLAWTNRQVNALNRIARRVILGREADRYPFIPGERVMSNKALFLPKRRDPTEASVDPFADIGLPEDDKTLVIAPDRWLEVVSATPETKKHSAANVRGTTLTVRNDDGNEYTFFVPSDWKAAKIVLGSYASRAARLTRERRDNPHKVSGAEVFDSWQAYYDLEDRYADIRAPYASTIHKSQGSTYKHSVIWMNDVAYARSVSMKMFARLMYVAITRASESVVFSDPVSAASVSR
jgi:exodeoxyribonuclease-5